MVVDASRLFADTLRILPRKRISRFFGSAADWSPPSWAVARAIDAFVRAYDVDLSEAIVPPGGFSSFNEFFTRRLREGRRLLANAPMLSPADGRVEDCGPIDERRTLLVKGRPYRVSDLIGTSSGLDRYSGGQFAIIYLSPRDYHRVHAPVTGDVASVRHVPGTLFPVNRVGLEHVHGLFARNERVAVIQETVAYGDVVTIMVGAMGVGRITTSFDSSVITNTEAQPIIRVYAPPRPHLAAGDELGVFHLGSTVIVFVEARRGLACVASPGERVRMGEALFEAR